MAYQYSTKRIPKYGREFHHNNRHIFIDYDFTAADYNFNRFQDETFINEGDEIVIFLSYKSDSFDAHYYETNRMQYSFHDFIVRCINELHCKVLVYELEHQGYHFNLTRLKCIHKLDNLYIDFTPPGRKYTYEYNNDMNVVIYGSYHALFGRQSKFVHELKSKYDNINIKDIYEKNKTNKLNGKQCLHFNDYYLFIDYNPYELDVPIKNLKRGYHIHVFISSYPTDDRKLIQFLIKCRDITRRKPIVHAASYKMMDHLKSAFRDKIRVKMFIFNKPIMFKYIRNYGYIESEWVKIEYNKNTGIFVTSHKYMKG